MKATIVGEDEKAIGILVVDNNGVEHEIEMYHGSEQEVEEYETGDISYHFQDGYGKDPEDRTLEESESFAQARRFARFYVYRKRGYQTLDTWNNPDHVMAAAVTVGQLTEDSFKTYFHDLYQQMCSHFDSVDPIVEIPDAVGDESPNYQQDIYLAMNVDELLELSENNAYSEAIEALLSLTGASVMGEKGFHDLSEIAADTGIDLSDKMRKKLADLNIEALSDIRITWWPPDAGTHGKPDTAGGDPPPGIIRDPDARIDLPPYQAESLDDFQRHLAYHLKCQVRDLYLIMGIAPAENLRVRGPGRVGHSTWFEHKDNYQRYYRQDVEITDWKVEHTPDDITY